MSIEGLPPAPDGFSRINKTDQVKTNQPAPEKVKQAEETAKSGGAADVKKTAPPKPESATEQNKRVQEPVTEPSKFQQGVNQQQEVGSKVSRHISELQALTETIQENQRNTQTRGEIISMNQSIAEMRRDLNKANGERYSNTIDAEKSYARLSYWEKMDVMEKSQTINRLKSDIRSSELDRAHLVNSLRQQVSDGSYSASGDEILTGMIDEFF